YGVILAFAHRAWAASERPSALAAPAPPAPPVPETRYPERVTVREWSRTHLVRPEDIDWIEADDNYVVVHAGTRTYKGRGRISDLESQLDPAIFVRVHRSAIVRVDMIREVQGLTKGDLALVLHDKKVVRVARGRRAALAAVLRKTLGVPLR
ncbi:MAG TPA: LytTR family DNA-binding domain-containing protein, partial [Gemmatimonadaceae bacterium]|nr:LytTR family DNA-binding domain-containing protein [Gemmatimonadaceae bacterium]